MIDVTQDIHSMTTFERNSAGLMKRMKKTGRPLVLTVNGKATAVLLDAAAYHDVADRLDALASIRRGTAQAKKGAVVPSTRCSMISTASLEHLARAYDSIKFQLAWVPNRPSPQRTQPPN